MQRPTGALPDRQDTRDQDASERDFSKQAAFGAIRINDDAFVQAMAWVRDQPWFPDCVGESVAAFIDSKLPAAPWASAVSIWREARRRQGKIEQIDIGTRIQYAVQGLVHRGWDPYRPGEEQDEVEAGKGAPLAGDDLEDEMFAYDKRVPEGLERYRIIGVRAAVLDAVDEALRRDFGVIIGTFLVPAFMAHVQTPDQADIVLGTDYFSGLLNSHAMRVRGRAVTTGGRRVYMLQNSWSRNWGGCHAPDGSWQPGCVWIDETALANAHDVHVLQLPTQLIAIN